MRGTSNNSSFHLTYEDCLNRRLVVANPRQKEAVLLLLGHVQDTRSALAKEYRWEKELEQALADMEVLRRILFSTEAPKSYAVGFAARTAAQLEENVR